MVNNIFTDRNLENLYVVHQLDSYMWGHKGFIAGGVFKNLLTNTAFKDVDIFFENERDWAEAVAFYQEEEAYIPSYENEKVKAFKNKHTGVRVELIRYIFGTPEQIISKFDFTIAKFAYYKIVEPETNEDGGTERHTERRVIHHIDFFEHLQMKRLVIDDQLVKPISSFERSYKYRDYGFRLCRESKVKLLTAIMQSDIESLDDDLVKSLYDGMD